MPANTCAGCGRALDNTALTIEVGGTKFTVCRDGCTVTLWVALAMARRN